MKLFAMRRLAPVCFKAKVRAVDGTCQANCVQRLHASNGQIQCCLISEQIKANGRKECYRPFRQCARSCCSSLNKTAYAYLRDYGYLARLSFHTLSLITPVQNL